MPKKDGTKSMRMAPVGKGKRGSAKMGGPFYEESYENCICPSCGYKMTYVGSGPCAHKICPKCKNKMTKNEK
jgi:hypothetical protein